VGWIWPAGRSLETTALDNLHAGIMNVTNCVNDILQKLNVFQERVNTLEMENSNLKRENKKIKCFLHQEYHKTDELDQYSCKENTRIYGIPEDFAGDGNDGGKKLQEIAAKLDIALDGTHDLQRVHRLGKKPRTAKAKSRGNFVRFVSYKKIQEFIKNRKKLKGTKISILMIHKKSVDSQNFLTQNADKSLVTCSIFLDLAKAFDAVNHDILLPKLNTQYGIKGLPLLLLKNYLENRSHYVVINDSRSGMSKFTCGVPQGSTLDPLLFLFYVNDLPLFSNFITILFADDTVFSLSANSMHELTTKKNQELENVDNWLKYNKLIIF